MTLEISNPDDLGREAQGARDEVFYWLPIMESIAKSPHPTRLMRELEFQTGVDEKSLHRKYYTWKNSGRDYSTLINRTKYPDKRVSGLPPAFVQYWRDLVMNNQRDTSALASHQMLVSQFALWEADPFNAERAIPGYVSPPLRTKDGLPKGWSYTRLLKLLPDRYNRTLKRQGPKAASEFMPSVYTTRVGLGFGQIVYFDDSLHDTYINLTGTNYRALRPLTFNCLEGLSGSLVEMLLKPQSEKEGGRMELNQLDFFWFVMLYLCRHGYNAKCGTILVFEHKTANVDKEADFDNRISQITGGLVRVDRSGKFGDPAFKGMLFGGQPSGNFRFKAPIESFFNIVRNRAGFLPGATGRNPDRAPEENYGLIQYNDRSLGLIDKIPERQFMRLRRPVLEWEDYCYAARLVHDLIDTRRTHDLEGWAKLGFTGQRYRLSTDSQHWLGEREYFALPDQQRQVLDALVCQPGYHETFNLSPREVYQANKSQLTKLKPNLIPILAPARAWEEITVSQKFEMSVEDPFIDCEPLLYIATVRNERGDEIHLERGKTYLRLLNPFDPTNMWIAEKDGAQRGRCIGIATRRHISCKTDSASLTEAMGEIVHLRANHSKDTLISMAPEAARRVEMHNYNRDVQAGRPVTADEKALAGSARRRIARESGEIEDLMPEALLPAGDPGIPADDGTDDIDQLI